MTPELRRLSNALTQRRNCERKRRFELKVKAQVAAIGLMNSPRKTIRAKVPLFVYSCPVCGGWHLTKNRNAVKP